MSIGGLHHLQVRKRIYKKFERYPSPNFFKRSLDTSMYGVAIVNPLMLVPQLYDVFATRSVAGLSLLSWSLLCACNILWTIYGLVHREAPLYIASAFFVLLELSIVLGILLYR